MVHVATVEANFNEPRDRIESLMCPQFDRVGQHHNDLYLINRDIVPISDGTCFDRAFSRHTNRWQCVEQGASLAAPFVAFILISVRGLNEPVSGFDSLARRIVVACTRFG
jgi:hypothetical protein